MKLPATLNNSVPPWSIVAAMVAVIGALAWTGWMAVSGREGSPGPDKKVYPGMYDLRAEAAKAIAARKSGTAAARTSTSSQPGEW